MELTQEDAQFLFRRINKAGSCNFTSERDTGTSSNSIVAIAYGMETLDNQQMPHDPSDLQACKNMWEKLPDHRKTDDAKQAMIRAEKAVEARWG